MKKFIKHAWFAVRHGDWDCGWGRVQGETWLSIDHGYYDCHYCCVRIGRLWIGVSY